MVLLENAERDHLIIVWAKIKPAYLWFAAGLLFAILWSSASTATKIGLNVAQPLVIAIMRFALASLCMLFFAHVLFKQKIPNGKEWLMLCVYGLLNISIYLGLYVVAMQNVTAGIGALAVATSPIFISFFSALLLGERLSKQVVLAIIIGLLGVICAAFPLFESTAVTLQGLLVLLLSMLSYSLASIYYKAKNWNQLSLLTINGWQTCIGGLILLPFACFYYDTAANSYTLEFWASVSWLAIPVSIFAIQLWLWLLKVDIVKAGIWLFLCPVFGFAIAAVMMHDKISWFTLVGVALVVFALMVSQEGNK